MPLLRSGPTGAEDRFMSVYALFTLDLVLLYPLWFTVGMAYHRWRQSRRPALSLSLAGPPAAPAAMLMPGPGAAGGPAVGEARLSALLARCLPRLTARLSDSGVNIDAEARFILEVREALDMLEAARLEQKVSLVEARMERWQRELANTEIPITEKEESKP